MSKTINVSVKKKIAVQTNDVIYICGNSDYVVDFDFDDEWLEHGFKTARFVYEGKYTDVVFEGNQCSVPVISNTYNIKVGVFAGDLRTSTPANISAKKSILCGSGTPEAPTPDVYNQMMELFNAEMGAVEQELNEALAKAKESGEFDGKDGADGKSAYQIALDNGFEGTEQEWLESLKGSGDAGQQLWKVTSFDITVEGDVAEEDLIDGYLLKVSDEPLDLSRVIAMEGIGYVGGDEPEHYRATQEEFEHYPYGQDGSSYEYLCATVPFWEIYTYPVDVVDEYGTVLVPSGTYVSYWAEDDHATRIVSNEAVEPVEPYVLPVHAETLTRAKVYTDQRFANELWLSENRAVERAVESAKKYTDSELDEAHEQIGVAQKAAIAAREEAMQANASASKAESNSRAAIRAINYGEGVENLVLQASPDVVFELSVDFNGNLVVTKRT